MLDKFWRAVGKRVWIKDYKDSLLHADTFRHPSPLNQPTYKRPTTEASDISKNPYFKRDTRRNYPILAVYTQADVAKLLNKPITQQISTETAETQPEKSESKLPITIDLNSALLSATPYSNTSLPPVPGKAYSYTFSDIQEIEQPGQYYPIYNVN
ncbi:hypothetical protein BB561_004652 [Smittium simulii]|uniref:NADH-ubiquinone oxidoreductase subunit B14.5a n=1 Tax=Smittium simulii TaxID=133385 RepID=A0A2T9YEZ3_9FUNG|nr:hypothetical protein BB561_004652 [Smittium simulii]